MHSCKMDTNYGGHSRQSGSAKSKLGVSNADGHRSIINLNKRTIEKELQQLNNQTLARIAKQQQKQNKIYSSEARASLAKFKNDIARQETKRMAAEADLLTQEQRRAIERRKAIEKAVSACNPVPASKKKMKGKK